MRFVIAGRTARVAGRQRLRVTRAARLWLTYGGAAVIAGVLASAIVLTSAQDQNAAVVLALLLPVSWAFSFAGIVAWNRQPENRTGPLLVLAGLTWLLGALGQADSSSLFTLGVLFRLSHTPFCATCCSPIPRDALRLERNGSS